MNKQLYNILLIVISISIIVMFSSSLLMILKDLKILDFGSGEIYNKIGYSSLHFSVILCVIISIFPKK